MVDWSLVEYCRWAIGVVVGKLHGQLEDEVGVGCVGRAVDGGGPQGHVLVVGEGSYAGRGLGHDVHELLLESGVGSVCRTDQSVGLEGSGVDKGSNGRSYRCATFAFAPFPRPFVESAMLSSLQRKLSEVAVSPAAAVQRAYENQEEIKGKCTQEESRSRVGTGGFG